MRTASSRLASSTIGFEQLAAAVLVELGRGPLQAAQHVLALQLRVAADAIVARSGQLFREQLRQLQRRRRRPHGIRIGAIDGRLHEDRNEVVVAGEDGGRAGAFEEPRVAGQHRLADRAREPADALGDLRFPPQGKIVPAAENVELGRAAMPPQQRGQRLVANLALRSVERRQQHSGRGVVFGLAEQLKGGGQSAGHQAMLHRKSRSQTDFPPPIL